jgi:hypothetical protein
MSIVRALFDRPVRPRATRPLPALTWLCCPYCGAKLARGAVEGRAVLEFKCRERGCRKIVTLTRGVDLRHTVGARRVRA